MSEIKKVQTVKSLLSSAAINEKFNAILKDRAPGFTANLAVMVSNSYSLANLDPLSVISSALIGASLDLSLDPNLGYAGIVPYGNKATFQIMFKGIIQLAIRSGQYKNIGVTEIYAGQLLEDNPLTGVIKFDFTKKGGEVIGYAAYFSLISGFEKTVFWSIEKIQNHALKYSKSFQNGKGLWIENFDAMAKKTVLKSLLKNFGILSIELKQAVKFDQSAPEIGKSIEAAEPLYLDAPGDTYTDFEPVVFNEDHAEFESAKQSFQAGHVTIEQLAKKYAIDKKELKELFTKV